jgi:hypothetical protein
MVRSLVERVQKDYISDDILNKIKEYSGCGAAISQSGVYEMLAKVRPSSAKLNEAYDLAEKGLVSLIEDCKAVAGLEYLQLMNHVAGLIAASGDVPNVIVDFSKESKNTLLPIMKSLLFNANMRRDRRILDLAVDVFRDYATKAYAHGCSTNPGFITYIARIVADPNFKITQSIDQTDCFPVEDYNIQ